MAYDEAIEHLNEGPSDQELWEDWLKKPACEMGAHPTVYHHQHAIGPATWHCFCGEVTREAKLRKDL